MAGPDADKRGVENIITLILLLIMMVAPVVGQGPVFLPLIMKGPPIVKGLAQTPAIWFEEGFEGLTHAPQGGPCEARPGCYYPFDEVEQGNWCSFYYPAKNILALEHDIVHSGATSLRMEMDRRYPIPYDERRINVGIEWDGRIQSDEAWFSFWIFLPDDFTAPSWVIILDFRQGDCGKGYIYLVEDGGEIYMVFRHIWWDKLDGAIVPPQARATHPLPRGRWIRVQAYYRQGWDDGRMTVWHDIDAGPDVEVLDVSGFTSYSDACEMYILWRYYSPYGPNTVFWDDVVVANGWVPRGYMVMEGG